MIQAGMNTFIALHGGRRRRFMKTCPRFQSDLAASETYARGGGGGSDPIDLSYRLLIGGVEDVRCSSF